jgi:dynein light intermediate chain 1
MGPAADGAALVYTSSSADRNCGALRQYIGHQLYRTACTVAPSAVDRDTVFIPAGWDSAPKIDALVAGLRTLHPDDPWEAVIKPPGAQRRARQAEAAVAAEDEQAFLAGIATALENGGSDPGAAPGPATPTPAPASGTAAAEREGGTSRAAPGAGAAAGTGKSDEAAMAFFNSLLQKSSTQRTKTGAAQVRTPPQAGRGPSPGVDGH